MNRKKMRRSAGEHVFDIGNMVFMIVMCLVMIYPLWYVLIIAFSNGDAARYGGIYFVPKAFTLDNFVYVFRYPGLWQAGGVTVARCIIASTFSILVNLMAAYALSKRRLKFRKVIIYFLLIPMFFGGTTVSRYIVMAKLNLINSFWVYVLPGAFGYLTAVLFRSFIDGLPGELQESAMMDGAGHVRIFGQIVVPLLKPSIAAFMFFGVVANWLDVQANVLYVTDRSLWVLQYIMHRVVASSEANIIIDTSSALTAEMQMRYLSQAGGYRPPTQLVIKMAIMVVVTFPMLMIYPFFQRFFVKGSITGAIKA